MFNIKQSLQVITLLTYLILFCSVYAADFLDDEGSFAEKYKDLRILLQKVTTEDLAYIYKARIDYEINLLRANQTTSPVDFKSLSDTEKKIFIKKFQKNRFHCGEVTAVANERRRILLRPKLAKILRDSLNKIP